MQFAACCRLLEEKVLIRPRKKNVFQVTKTYVENCSDRTVFINAFKILLIKQKRLIVRPRKKDER